MIKKIFLKLKSLPQSIKFLFVGGLNTVVGVGVELITYLIMGLPFSLSSNVQALPWQIAVATTISYTIGTAHSYVWNKFFTFESKDKSVGEVLRFVAVYAVQLVINFAMKWALIELLGINTYVAMIITLLVTTCISFFGHKLFSFRNCGAPAAQADSTSGNEEN